MFRSAECSSVKTSETRGVKLGQLQYNYDNSGHSEIGRRAAKPLGLEALVPLTAEARLREFYETLRP